MPNHIHGIIVLDGNNENVGKTDGGENICGDETTHVVETTHGTDNRIETTRGVETTGMVETTHALSLRSRSGTHQSADRITDGLSNEMINHKTDKTIGQQRFQNQGKNTLSSIVGSYKSAVTKHARRLGFDFEWQTRFHDHIIRNDDAFRRISDYIINNPLEWEDDKFNKDNKGRNL